MFWKSGGPSRDAVLTHAPLPPQGVWTSPANAREHPFRLRVIEAEIALHRPARAGRMAQPGGQQPGGIAQRVRAPEDPRLAAADGDGARLLGPRARLVGAPGAEHQGAVRLEVGQLEQRRRL